MSEQTKINQGGPPPTYQATSNDYAGNESQQGHPPQQPAYNRQVVQTQQPLLAVSPPMIFGQSPVYIRCPHCQAEVTTKTVHEAGTLTWLIAGLLCLVGCVIGCCAIPFCVDDLQDVHHRYPNCRRVVGVYKRM